eukprot:2385528-Prymnesium_polylepis.1
MGCPAWARGPHTQAACSRCRRGPAPTSRCRRRPSPGRTSRRLHWLTAAPADARSTRRRRPSPAVGRWARWRRSRAARARGALCQMPAARRSPTGRSPPSYRLRATSSLPHRRQSQSQCARSDCRRSPGSRARSPAPATAAACVAAARSPSRPLRTAVWSKWPGPRCGPPPQRPAHLLLGGGQ